MASGMAGGMGGPGARVGGPPPRDGRERDSKEKGLRVNGQIRAREVRVIDDDGKMLGVFGVPEAIKLAEERSLDLIEIAPTANPPTCKIMDYGKYKYEQKKKAHEARKNQTIITIKELQLRPRTEQHDLDVKLRHARRFLEDGDKTRIALRFRGRELAHQEIGQELLRRVMDSLKDIAVVETPPKMEGKQMFVLLAPDPVKLKELRKENKVREPLPELPPEPEHDDDEDEVESPA
jgi:translation initiation factor IF-3